MIDYNNARWKPEINIVHNVVSSLRIPNIFFQYSILSCRHKIVYLSVSGERSKQTQFHFIFLFALLVFRTEDKSILTVWSNAVFQITRYFNSSRHFPLIIAWELTSQPDFTSFPAGATQPIVCVFYSPLSGFSLLAYEVTWSHTTTRHSR
jgi:hypothetical protein